MTTRTWKQSVLAAPGIAVALLPKVACPFCWPVYAGILSSLGLGFVMTSAYLLPITVGFLSLAVFALAFKATERRGYAPMLLGVVGSGAMLIGKFYLDMNSLTYVGIALLVAASIWNAWPRRVVACPCKVLIEGK